MKRKAPTKPKSDANAKPVKKPSKAKAAAKPKLTPAPKREGRQPPKVTGRFADALERVKAIAAKQASAEAKMLEICWFLNSKFPTYNWVGFYIATRDRQLVLGPFVGEPTEHTHIPFGKGICGQAAERGETFVVDDVSKEANYLSCSMYVRSEIVVPIITRGEIAGELDIDSHTPNAFTRDDCVFLEKVCALLSEIM